MMISLSFRHNLFIKIILLSSLFFISETESVTSLCANIKSCEDCLSLKGIGCKWIQAWSNYNGTMLSPINEKCEFLSTFGPLDTDPTKVYKVYENACPCQFYQYGFETDPVLAPEYNFTENGAPLSGFSSSAYEGDRSFVLRDPASVSDTKLTLTIFLDPIVIGGSSTSSIQLNFKSYLYMEYASSTICYDGAFIMIEEDIYSNGTFYEIDYTEYVVSVPYTQTISENFYNPYAGHVAWCRSSSLSTFDIVYIDITQFIGKTIKVSWVTGSDDQVASAGWFIDDIRIIYDCVINNSCSYYSNDCETCLSPVDDINCVWYKSWNVTSPIAESCVSTSSSVQPANMTAPVVLYKTNTTYPELSCPCVTFSETFENGINTTYSILEISEPFSGISIGYASETNSLHLGEVPYPSAEKFTLLNLNISGPSPNSIIELCFDSLMRLEQAYLVGCYDAAFITIQYNETYYYEDVESLLSKPYFGPISTVYSNPYAGKRGWCDQEFTLFKTPLERICIDLSIFNGHQLNITWITASDSSFAMDGWYIDNIELNNDCKRSSTNNKKKHHKKNHHHHEENEKVGLVIGLVIGGIVLIGIIVFVVYMSTRRSNRVQRQRMRYQQQYNY